MQCPDCKQLRHTGPCEPVYEDEPTDLEMLEIEYGRTLGHLEELKRKLQKEHSHESR